MVATRDDAAGHRDHGLSRRRPHSLGTDLGHVGTADHRWGAARYRLSDVQPDLRRLRASIRVRPLAERTAAELAGARFRRVVPDALSGVIAQRLGGSPDLAAIVRRRLKASSSPSRALP